MKRPSPICCATCSRGDPAVAMVSNTTSSSCSYCFRSERQGEVSRRAAHAGTVAAISSATSSAVRPLRLRTRKE